MAELEGWDYWKRGVLAKAKITGENLDFPVLISFTDVNFKDIAHGGKVAQSAGQDLYVADATGTVQLSHEIQYYNPATGQVIIHFKTPLASSTEDLVIYLYCGNAVCADQQDAEAVWDTNYKLVMHMQDATTSTVNDSTSNHNHGTKRAANEPLEVAGKIYKGQDFDVADNDYIDCGTCGDAVFTEDGAVTLSAWINPVSLGHGNEGTIFDRGIGAAGPAFTLQSSNRLFFRVDGATDLYRYSANDVISLAADQYVVVTWDGSTTHTGIKFYVGGVEVGYGGAANGVSLVDNSAKKLFLGRCQWNLYHAFDGVQSESRAAATVRSPNWIATEYLNQVDPSVSIIWGALSHRDPTCQIDDITPSPAIQDVDTVAFTGTVTDTVVAIAAWEWSSDIDGVIGTTEDFELAASDMTLGTHVISFRVQDVDGQWSATVTGTLTIGRSSARRNRRWYCFGL